MILTKEQIFEVCKNIAPKYGFEITLIQALCLQECGKNKNRTFAPSRARMEPGFYSRYIEKQDLETTNEIMYSASFGVPQMMGQSLKEIGYFDFYFSQQSPEMKIFLGNPYSEISVPKALNAFCVNLEWMIEWGCKWLSRKRDLAHGDIFKTLGLWNGDQTGGYANEVLDKQKSLK